MKICDLEGAELNAWVAKALGWKHLGAVGLTPTSHAQAREIEARGPQRWCLSGHNDWWDDPEGRWHCGPCYGVPFLYSQLWELGGPIIEREGIMLIRNSPYSWERTSSYSWDALFQPIWGYDGPESSIEGSGPTALIAAMRCFVASKFGELIPADSAQIS